MFKSKLLKNTPSLEIVLKNIVKEIEKTLKSKKSQEQLNQKVQKELESIELKMNGLVNSL